MTTMGCRHCGQAMDATASICRKCKTTLEIALTNVADYYADVNTLRSRQTRLGSGGRSTQRAEAPLGVDLRFTEGGSASKAIAATRNAVITWTRYLLEHIPPVEGPVCAGCLHVSCAVIRKTGAPWDNVGPCCRYLGRNADWFRVSDVGAEILRDMLTVESKLRRLIDSPPDKWYAGICSAPTSIGECQVELYASVSEGLVHCPGCHASHDVKTRRAWLLKAAEEYELTASEMARAVVVLGEYDGTEQRLSGRIRVWAHRAQIIPVRHEVIPTADGGEIRKALYRVRDVLDLLAEDARHAEEKRLQRSSRRPRATV